MPNIKFTFSNICNVGIPFKSRYLFQERTSFLFLFALFLIFSVSLVVHIIDCNDVKVMKNVIFCVCCIIHFIFFYFEQALIAIVLAVLTVVLVGIQSRAQSAEPARILSLKDYSPTEVLYNKSNESFNIYECLVKNEGSSVKNPGKPINHALMEIAENNRNYRTQYIVAAEFNESHSLKSLNAMYSSAAFHSAPISLNLLTNAVLNHRDKNRSITVINHPLETKQVRW